MRCVLLLAVIGCGKHLNPDWCREPGHVDPACPGLLDAGTRSCTESDCPDSTCLPDGTCAPAGSVLHASPGGTGDCSSRAKCSLATAISKAMPDRNVIALDTDTYLGPITVDHPVRIVGHGARLDGPPAGPVVTVMDGVSAELDDLSVTGATTGIGVSCASGSLVMHLVKIIDNQLGVSSMCSLKLDRSLVAGNREGALAIVTGDIDIRNNFIVNNGNPMLKGTSNVTIAAMVTGSFTFNTVAYNDAKVNSTPGVICDAPLRETVGNLITDNTHRGMFMIDPQVQVSGGCNFAPSYTTPDTGPNAVHWKNVAESDFHLTAQSAIALDSPALSCDDRDDIDGQARPIGGGCDYGADEYQPPP